MIKYKLAKNFQGELECIVDKQSNRAIPIDEKNQYYQEYLKWLDGYEMNEIGEWVKVSEGNTPEPADE